MPRELSEQEFTRLRDGVLAALPPNLTEAEFERTVGPAFEQALGEAENSPRPVEGSAMRRLVGNAASMLNPVAMAQGLYGAVRHPLQTLTDIGTAQVDQGSQALQAGREGRYSEAAGHGLASLLPVLGPAAAGAGEQIGSGDVAGGFGTGAGLLIPALVPPAIRAARQRLPAATKTAADLETSAASRVADVMAPKIGPNKTRFGGMAEKTAPELLERGDVGGWSREGLADRVGSKLVQAEQALDEAADARLSARTFPVQPIISDLTAKRRALMAETVDASKPVQKATERTSPILDASGKPIQVTERTTEALGKDVVPGPNAVRVAEIDRAIAELKALGPVARYEPLRRIRQSYDGPAKTVYSPSMTADFLKAQGGKLGAADVTGTLREHLARFDPQTAAANADYSLYRMADDVLTATAEVERTRPRVGRQIIARLTGATVGASTAGPAGAIAGFVFGPAVEAALGAGVTTKLQTAKLMNRLAQAVRRGDLGMVNSLSYQLKKLGAQAATVKQATSPSAVPAETQPAY